MEPLKMTYGRKIRTIHDCESPFEIFLYFNHYGRGLIRNPLEQQHIIQVMLDCRYTMAGMAKSTGLSASTLGKWKKRHCPKLPGKLYVLVDERQGAFKVGITRGAVEDRVRALQTSLAGDLKIFLTLNCLDPERVEKFLHSFLKSQNKHLKREWFNLDEDTEAYLGELKKRAEEKWLKEDFCVEIKHWRMWKESTEGGQEVHSPNYVYEMCL